MTMIELKAERKGKDAAQPRRFPCPREQRQIAELWIVEAKQGYGTEFWS
jgi:hypothetical protein